MRLRQLARKLGVQPDKILGVLTENGHELANEANSKLTDEQVSLAEAHFAPEPAAENEEADAAEAVVEPSDETDVPVIEDEAEPVVQETNAEEETAADPEMEAFEVPFGPPSHATSQVSDTEENDAEPAPLKVPRKIQLEPEVKVYRAYEEDESLADAELIETEKPKLEGLTVLGKIELPEPKKPEPEAEADTESEKEEAAEEKPQRRNQRQQNGRGRRQKGQNQRHKLNPVEYERQKAERLAKKKKLEEEKRLKEKKKEHYLAKQKAKAPANTPKKKKPVREEESIAPLPINGMSRKKPEAKPVKKEKRGLKKLWAWLNGEYDQFG